MKLVQHATPSLSPCNALQSPGIAQRTFLVESGLSQPTLHTVTMKLEWAVQSLASVLYQYSQPVAMVLPGTKLLSWVGGVI